uniref:TTC5_OB domain-containing protein n=1 Tax=Schistosoma mansoni TaxID=6183 RepID=A0A5K4F1N8_SCHMA
MIQLEALPKTHQNHLQWDESILNKIKSSVDDLYALKNKFLNEWADKFGMLNDSASEVWMKADNIHSMIMESCELNKNKNEITQSKFEDTVSIFKEYESAFIHAPVLDKAEFCYQYGKPKHVKALCNLSMVLRQPPNTTTNISENIDNISSYEADKSKSLSSSSPSSSPTSDTTMKCSIFHQSVNLAHKAVSQQPTNGYAWSVLGNALLTLFFKSFSSTTTSTTVSSSDQNSSINKSPLISSSPQLIMTRCIAAYAQAVKDRSIALEPNFHYNRGLAWHYQDLFGQTLKCWLQALCLDPEWPAPQYGIKRIIKFIMEWHKLMKQFHKKQSIHVHFTEIESNQIESSYGTLKTSPINHESSVDTQQMINEDEFISPLSPLKKLIVTTVLESSNTINPDSSTSNNNSNNDVVLDQSDISQNALSLNPKEISALNRLLGPYCPFSDNDKNKSGSNFQTKRSSTGSKKKKQLKASKYSSNNNNSNDTLTDSSKTNDNPLNSLVNSHCLQFTPFNNLQVGLNKNTVCIGRVFAELPNDSDLALNLLLIDPYGTPFAVRLYNVGKGVGPTRKDIIAIPHPFVEEILIEGFVLHACLNALSIIDNQYLSDMIEKFSYLRTSTATTTTTDNEVSSNGSSSANCTKSESNTQSSNDETTINLPNQLMNLHMRVIRVPLPNFLVVNGQTVGSSWTAVPVLKNIFFA